MDASVSSASAFLKQKLGTFTPEVGVVLGSGMGMFADQARDDVRIPYQDIPGFPVSTVEGHAGLLVCGTIAGKKCLIMQGRFHYYEGYAPQQLVIPVRVMRALGAHTLVVTNAAGGVNPAYKAGDLMLIRDHINFIFNNPLFGPNDPELGPRFPDTSRAYTPELLVRAKEVAASLGIPVREGVYQMMTGPSYETPAEVRMAATCGADAVGMSTVPEVIAAAHCGMKVLGMSYIANLAAGLSPHPLSHQEVMDTMNTIRDTFIRLLTSVIQHL